jgi:hypothetical protein
MLHERSRTHFVCHRNDGGGSAGRDGDKFLSEHVVPGVGEARLESAVLVVRTGLDRALRFDGSCRVEGVAGRQILGSSGGTFCFATRAELWMVVAVLWSAAARLGASRDCGVVGFDPCHDPLVPTGERGDAVVAVALHPLGDIRGLSELHSLVAESRSLGEVLGLRSCSLTFRDEIWTNPRSDSKAVVDQLSS